MPKQEQKLTNTTPTNTSSVLFAPPEKDQSHIATNSAEFSPRQSEKKPTDHKLTPMPQGIDSLNPAVYSATQSQNKAEPTSQNKTNSSKKFKDGIYKGESLNGSPDGIGEYKFNDGSIFKGEYKNGKQHGMGKMIVPGVGTYEGCFFNYIPEGEIKFTSVRGLVMTTTYKNGQVIEGKVLSFKGVEL